MSGKHHSSAQTDSQSFAFTPENLEYAHTVIAKYPQGRQQAALLPLLMLAQRQNENWLSKSAMDYIADMLGMPFVRVYEVVTFYTMYNLEPVGRYMIEICTTTPCWLRGSDDIVKTCEQKLGVSVGQTSDDGMFTLREAECLGSCASAPMCQIGDHYYEDLTPETMINVIEVLARGQEPAPGSQAGRKSCEPAGGLTSLKEVV